MAILIKNAEVYDGKNTKKYRGICIKNGRIQCMTDDDSVIDNFKRLNSTIDIIDGKDKLVMPGLVNTHTHSPMTVLRNIGSDLPLHDWLFNQIFPREAKLKPKDVYYGSLYGQIEMIKSGTVSFTDMYDPFDSLAQAVFESGLKASVSVATLHNDWSGKSRVTNAFFSEAEDTIKKWNYVCPERLKILCEIHSIYLYDYRLLSDVVSFAKEHNMGINMHLHETETEINDSINMLGVRPIDFFESIGAFDVPVTAAHCTHLTDRDMDILLKNNVLAAVNMTSNLKLASGIPNLPKMIEKGLQIGFGTDGCASNNNLNMFEEMHLAGILYKGLLKDPLSVSAKDVIRIASLDSKICEGSAADIIIIDMSATHLHPVNNIESLIVYSMQGSDVETVIVDGKILMKNREVITLDEEKIRYEVENVKF